MKRFISSLISFSLSAVLCAQGVFAAPSAITNVQTAEETQFGELTYTEEITEKENDAVLSGRFAALSIQTAEETEPQRAKPKINDASLFALLEGEGTQDSPYLITNAIDLTFFANNVNMGIDSDKHYKLTDDIDLGGDEWTPAGYFVSPSSEDGIEEAYKTVFSGVFDGDGHTISNFKITNADTSYVGLFGYVCNATIKNITIDDAIVNVASTKKSNLYVSVLAGRITTRGNNGKTVIENCKVTNSSINAKGVASIYAGAIGGIAVATNVSGSKIEASLLNADCDITVSTSPASSGKVYDLTAGGIFGYYGSQTNSQITLRDAHYDGIVIADASATSYANTFAGGVVGGLVIREKTYYTDSTQSTVNYVIGGAADISSCSSKGSVVAKALTVAYSGGFSGYIDSTVDTYITDCYSSADCSADDFEYNCIHYTPCKVPCEYVCVGGFAGYIPFHGYSSSFPKTFINCYASGDAIDLEIMRGATPELETSYGGNIFGYSEADIFANTYKLSSQEVNAREIPKDLLPELDEESAMKASSYEDFDFKNVWEINPSAAYPYPTLREKITYVTFVNENEFFDYFAVGASGYIVAPEKIPEKAPTTKLVYTFSHWSLEENGTAFDFEENTVFERTTLYAVYESAPRTYTVNYYVDGEIFIPESVFAYGTPLTQTPMIPTREETAKFAYVFSYWSETEDGPRVDFTGLICDRDYKFYAVFTEIDKTAWGGEVADGFSDGNGSQALPYIISSSEEFALFSELVNSGDTHFKKAYYRLGDDINLGNNFWVPVGTENNPFSGELDGNGYTIRNYKISAARYAGLFGYIYNAAIKNLTLSNYEITFPYTTSGDVYIGGVAGYALADKNADCIISNVCVANKEFNVAISAQNIYAGGFVGYGKAGVGGEMLIENCYTQTPITVRNNNAQVYLGGIVGYLSSSVSTGKAHVKYCYSTADLDGYAQKYSCRVGGIAGNIYYHGDFTPEVELSGVLAADDMLCMISNSFSVANLSSHSEDKDNTFVGRIVAYVTQFAYCDEDTTRYLSQSASNGIITVSPQNETMAGSGTSLANLKSTSYLTSNLGFDFENTWMEVKGDFPVLKTPYLDKPTFKLTNVQYEGTSLTVSVNFLAKDAEISTLVFVVKNARNQTIKLERVDVKNTGVVEQIPRTYENLPFASSVTVMAVDKQSLVPLFPSLESGL